jgi:hypothetical protein
MRFQQGVGIEAAPLQDEIILFHSASNRFCVLNRTSSLIWSQLKEPRLAITRRCAALRCAAIRHASRQPVSRFL